MAIAMALAGGIGIIHRNQSIEAQADMVKRVRQFHNGFILNPHCLKLQSTVADIDRIKELHGCGAIPITDNGKVGGKFLGLVTSRDVESISDRSTLLKAVMIPAGNVVTAKMPVRLPDLHDSEADLRKEENAEEILLKNKVGKLPILDEDNKLMALLCRGDVNRVRAHMKAARDHTRQLMVGASVAANTQDDWERCEAMIDAGADVLYVDIDEGVTNTAVDFIRRLKAEHSGDVEVLVGRVSSVQQAELCLHAGADGLRVGCFACGGAAEATGLYEIARYARQNYGVPVCADEVGTASRMFKALCLGAATVSMTGALARCEEAPGDHFYQNGVRVRLHSPEALGEPLRAVGGGLGIIGEPLIKKSIAGATIDRGSARTLVPHFARQLEKGLRDLCLHSIQELHIALSNGELRMERQLAQTKPQEDYLRVVRLASSSLNNRW
jgi:IMP dehydrogenase